jgi:hypothetical protein
MTNLFRKYIRDFILPYVIEKISSKIDHGFKVSLNRRSKIKPDSKRTVGDLVLKILTLHALI